MFPKIWCLWPRGLGARLWFLSTQVRILSNTPQPVFPYWGLKQERIKRDKIKKELCDKNGINLIYFSNLKIKYPYFVYEDKINMLKYIIYGEKI